MKEAVMAMRTSGLSAAFWLAGAALASDLPQGDLELILIEADGTEHAVARIDIDGSGYDIEWDDSRFTDAFLSMRPFKCLEGPETMWCRVPYPYANDRDLSAGLTDLEYDLLFVWKPAGAWGVDLWNGVYYRLTPGEGRLSGTMHAVDLDLLSAPPPEGVTHPIGPADLEPVEPGSHWLPRLEIR